METHKRYKGREWLTNANTVKRCAVCGKEFDISGYDINGYVYKMRGGREDRSLRWMCSYPCYKKYKEERKKRK